MEAPRHVVVCGGMTHISEPLAVIYADIRRRIVCYEAVERMLTEAEEKLRKLVFDDLWNHYDLGNQCDNAVEAAEAISDMAVSAIAIGDGVGCCADALVRMQDAIERLEDRGDDYVWLKLA